MSQIYLDTLLLQCRYLLSDLLLFYILKNGEPFHVRGVVYVPGYPGYMPWDIENSTNLPSKLKESIEIDLVNIRAMGANTIRFWGAPEYCYELLKDIDSLHFIQTIWFDGAQNDFQDSTFKENTKAYIRSVVDRVYSVFTDNNPPLIAWIAGNELSESGILSTNSAHPEITGYQGEYITAENINASEAFIAEMADYIRSYEFENYGRQSLISYANEIRTFDLISTPFLDFRCHNAYSYAIPYFRPQTQPGSYSGTLFQGWVEEIKAKYPDKPLLISETGLSISPEAPHIGPPNYGYGGNTEEEQATGILQNITDINTAKQPIAGVCVHEYLDAWWKYSLEDSYSQDPYDVEEWFGVVRLIEDSGWYKTAFRKVYYKIQEQWNGKE